MRVCVCVCVCVTVYTWTKRDSVRGCVCVCVCNCLYLNKERQCAWVCLCVCVWDVAYFVCVTVYTWTKRDSVRGCVCVCVRCCIYWPEESIAYFLTQKVWSLYYISFCITIYIWNKERECVCEGEREIHVAYFSLKNQLHTFWLEWKRCGHCNDQWSVVIKTHTQQHGNNLTTWSFVRCC